LFRYINHQESVRRSRATLNIEIIDIQKCLITFIEMNFIEKRTLVE